MIEVIFKTDNKEIARTRSYTSANSPAIPQIGSTLILDFKLSRRTSSLAYRVIDVIYIYFENVDEKVECSRVVVTLALAT